MSNISIYEAIGICWVVLTSCLATVLIFYAAYCSLRHAIFPPRLIKNMNVRVGSKEVGVDVPTGLNLRPRL